MDPRYRPGRTVISTVASQQEGCRFVSQPLSFLGGINMLFFLQIPWFTLDQKHDCSIN